jgi:hypothetical protein
MCFGRIVALLLYWRKSPPVHDLLALRYLGPQEQRTVDSGQGSVSRPDNGETVSQTPQIARFLGVPVRKMSDKTRALYEYAQSVIHPKEASKKDESGKTPPRR